ncbi:hypothetical protein C8Q80DRAFT_899202 [Daedaleopsis nitida]|nr:hypothetical protein C8Q80DRAFT_899202 [Daedaleopsis nitida]
MLPPLTRFFPSLQYWILDPSGSCRLRMRSEVVVRSPDKVLCIMICLSAFSDSAVVPSISIASQA